MSLLNRALHKFNDIYYSILPKFNDLYTQENRKIKCAENLFYIIVTLFIIFASPLFSTWKKELNEQIIVVDESDEIGNNKLLYPNIAIISDLKDPSGPIWNPWRKCRINGFFEGSQNCTDNFENYTDGNYSIWKFNNKNNIYTYDNSNVIILQLQFRYNISETKGWYGIVYPPRVYFGTFENDADLNITKIVTTTGGLSASSFQIITISKTIINKDNKNESIWTTNYSPISSSQDLTFCDILTNDNCFLNFEIRYLTSILTTLTYRQRTNPGNIAADIGGYIGDVALLWSFLVGIGFLVIIKIFLGFIEFRNIILLLIKNIRNRNIDDNILIPPYETIPLNLSP